MLLVSAGVLAILFARAENREFHLPGGDGTIVMIAGAWAAILIFYRMLDKPSLQGNEKFISSVGIEWGIFIALLVALGLSYVGKRIRAAERGEPPTTRAAGAEDRPPGAESTRTRRTVADPDFYEDRGSRRAPASASSRPARRARAGAQAKRAARGRIAQRPSLAPPPRSPALPAGAGVRVGADVLRGRAAARGVAGQRPGGRSALAAYHCADDVRLPQSTGARADVRAGRRGGPARGRLPAGRVDGARLVPGDEARQAGARRGTGGRRQDGAREGAVEVPRARARAPAVLRGPRRGEGAVRVELPQAAPADPGGGVGHGLGRGAGGHLRRGVPARAAADDARSPPSSPSCC